MMLQNSFPFENKNIALKKSNRNLIFSTKYDLKNYIKARVTDRLYLLSNVYHLHILQPILMQIKMAHESVTNRPNKFQSYPYLFTPEARLRC